MAGLAAVFLDRGATVDREAFDRLCQAIPCRTTDGLDTWFGDGAALACFHSTDSRDGLIEDAASGLVLAFDGRLDNREALAGALSQPVTTTDARLALEAIIRWDVDAPAHMLGDYACIAWDRRRRRVLLARDHIGLRPLHYVASARRIVCGSDIAHLLTDPSVPRRPNPRVAAQYLACDMSNGSETLYEGISRVQPAHVVTIEQGVTRRHQYWTGEPRTRIAYRSDDEYADHCRELLVQSVRDRMRSSSRVAATLSGGIDSSSVALTAHRLVRDLPPPSLYSMLFPGHPEADEREFVDAVAARCATTPTYVTPATATRSLAFRASSWMNAPAMAADHTWESLWNTIRRDGHRVALTGAGGDFAFAGSIFAYADLIRAGRFGALLQRYRDDLATDCTGKNAFAWLQAGVWPALPRAVKRALRPLARRAGTRAGIVEHRAWLRLPVEAEPLPDGPRGGAFAVEDILRGLLGGFHSYALEGSERVAAEAGVELRHPLLDVRLTEFVLAIPEEQRRRGTITKFVLRRALRDEMPPLLATRTSKGDFAHCVWDAVERLGEPFYKSLAIAGAGWVDGDAILALYRRMRDEVPAGPETYGRYIPEIWMVTAVELWFRAAFAGAETAAV